MSKRKLKDEIVILRPFGDTDLLMSVFSTSFWRLIFSDNPNTIIPFLKAVLTFAVEMFAYSIRVFLRIRPGKRAGGWILAFFTAGMMIIYNHESIAWSVAPVLIFILPFFLVLIFFLGRWPEEWPMDWFTSIESSAMQIFLFLFLVRAAIQNIMVSFFDKANPHSAVSRGDSLLYKILPDKSRVEEDFVKVYAEPVMVFLLGLLLYKIVDEKTLGWFLMLAAISLFIQEQYESAVKRLL